MTSQTTALFSELKEVLVDATRDARWWRA